LEPPLLLLLHGGFTRRLLSVAAYNLAQIPRCLTSMTACRSRTLLFTRGHFPRKYIKQDVRHSHLYRLQPHHREPEERALYKWISYRENSWGFLSFDNLGSHEGSALKSINLSRKTAHGRLQELKDEDKLLKRAILHRRSSKLDYRLSYGTTIITSRHWLPYCRSWWCMRDH
jgi:hypothetical protein